MDISVSGDETASIFMFRIAAVALHTECGRQTRPCVPGRTTHHTPYKATRLQAVTGRSKARLALERKLSHYSATVARLRARLGWSRYCSSPDRLWAPLRGKSEREVHLTTNNVHKLLLRSTPMKMELLGSSETSALKAQTPGDYPKDKIQHSAHGESSEA